MELRVPLIRMLKQLMEDTLVIHQQGAGYYTCAPIASRYNKLLAQTRAMFSSHNVEALVATFEDIPDSDPTDPSEKQKVLQGIRIEIGQLLTLLEYIGEAQKQEEGKTP